jgi:hypothetical protein
MEKTGIYIRPDHPGKIQNVFGEVMYIAPIRDRVESGLIRLFRNLWPHIHSSYHTQLLVQTRLRNTIVSRLLRAVYLVCLLAGLNLHRTCQ